jgi:hypothetical protein
MKINKIIGMEVKSISLAEIKEYKNNPRKHLPKQIAQIAASIKEFGFTNPLRIDENHEILAGHGRLLAAKQLGLSEAPAIKLAHLTDNQKRLYRIADNKLTENGDWDVNLLKLEFAEIEALGLEADLNITGFETAEIDLLMAATPADPELNAMPEVHENEIAVQLGDIWQLGAHKVLCGDLLKKKSFTALMGQQKADVVFTDPPYNVKINGHVCGGGETKHQEFKMASGEMSKKEFAAFLQGAAGLMAEFSQNGSIHFIYMDWRHAGEVMTASVSVYTELKNICVWNKDNGGMGSLYRSKHEFVFVYKKGKQSHVNNIELGKHGRYRTNVWDYAGVNSFGKNRTLLSLHPTVKPVEMIMCAKRCQ